VREDFHHAERDAHNASGRVCAQQKTHGGLPWVLNASPSLA
jgi:hypothetical protein